MLVHEFSVEDLSLTRFAISPMWELMSAVRTLHDPARGAHHLPWIREALPIARGLGIERALALTPPTGYMPDFLTPPPSSPVTEFESEIALVRETPAAQVRKEVAIMIRDRRSTAGGPVAEAFVEHPRRELARSATASRRSGRRRSLRTGRASARCSRPTYAIARAASPRAARRSCSPTSTRGWRGSRRCSRSRWSTRRRSRSPGRGLVIMPSVFESTRPVSISNAPWQPTLIYPSRGVALLWEPGSDAGPAELAALVGGTRADLLVSLASARTTTELAELLSLHAGGISHHLGVLRGAGLVSRERSGRTVLYMRTPLAERLLGAGAGERA